MAANVVLYYDPEKWEIIREFLSMCEEGAIVLGPDAILRFRQRYGLDPMSAMYDQPIEYDFGGQPDILVDHVIDPGHHAALALASAMGSMIPHYDDGECPDCLEAIPSAAVDGSHCENCGHVFSAPRETDGPHDG